MTPKITITITLWDLFSERLKQIDWILGTDKITVGELKGKRKGVSQQIPRENGHGARHSGTAQLAKLILASPMLPGWSCICVLPPYCFVYSHSTCAVKLCKGGVQTTVQKLGEVTE